ncbi:hypothetical protein BOTCAL_0262g00040 [Botryotinia calthae]|uniref:Uncharacterized protein n=1 Tax=Botryotinia calthae TaxID=38488 RepID=A0A4Y8CYV1_9HELO|nr:hypothetical protein BOTCAL_0262g00040 [Botryotinia calthae]
MQYKNLSETFKALSSFSQTIILNVATASAALEAKVIADLRDDVAKANASANSDINAQSEEFGKLFSVHWPAENPDEFLQQFVKFSFVKAPSNVSKDKFAHVEQFLDWLQDQVLSAHLNTRDAYIKFAKDHGVLDGAGSNNTANDGAMRDVGARQNASAGPSRATNNEKRS